MSAAVCFLSRGGRLRSCGYLGPLFHVRKLTDLVGVAHRQKLLSQGIAERAGVVTAIAAHLRLTTVRISPVA